MSDSIRNQKVLRPFLKLLLPFWKSEQKWTAIGLLFAILAIVVGNVYAMVQLNHWNKAFYDALQNLNQPEFFKQIYRFLGIALVYIFISAYRNYLTMLLQIRWRQWMTDGLIQQWLTKKRFYYWQITEAATDNPDQRITEDVQEFINLTLEIFLGFFREILTLASFITILWTVSGNWVIPNLFGYKIEVISYMVWACLIYAILGTWITNKVGIRLVSLNFIQQKFEADFRYFLIRLRENSESIALANGEVVEKKGLSDRFKFVVQNFKLLADKQKQVSLVTNLYSQLAMIFPHLVSAPRLFAKQITMGQMFQISSAFGQVHGSFSFIIDYYRSIVRWRAVIFRLETFLQNMDQLEHSFDNANSKIKTIDEEALILNEISLATPDNQPLLQNLNLKFKKSTSTVIKAKSGFGKSTLFRAIVGLWPNTRGSIQVPREKIMVLPQKPHMPLGSFKDIVCYPHISQTYTNDQVTSAMMKCRLEKFVNVLNSEANWSASLSPGEQQRVSFARVLLQQPSWLLLDEATSALDEDNQKYFYNLMKQEIPGITIVSIAHRESAMHFHEFVLDLEGESAI